MDDKVAKKKESTVNKGGLVVAILILIGLIVGGYFLVRYIIDFFTNQETETSDKEEESYNKLLTILNNEVSKSASPGEKKASKLLTFDYSNSDHFYISGVNNVTIFSYDIDLSSISSINDIDTAYNYVINNDLSGYVTTVTRYTLEDFSELNNKYPSSNVKTGTLVSATKVFGTLLINNNINIINGDELSVVLDNSYSPKTINSSSSLYNLYKYVSEI